MNIFESTFAIVAIAIAASAPITVVHAGGDGCDSDGRSVFEIQREKRAKKLADLKKQDDAKLVVEDKARSKAYKLILAKPGNLPSETL